MAVRKTQSSIATVEYAYAVVWSEPVGNDNYGLCLARSEIAHEARQMKVFFEVTTFEIPIFTLPVISYEPNKIDLEPF